MRFYALETRLLSKLPYLNNNISYKTAHSSLHTCTLHTASTLWHTVYYYFIRPPLLQCKLCRLQPYLPLPICTVLYLILLYYTLLYHYFPPPIFTVLYYTLLYFSISLLSSPYLYWLLLKTRFQIK